MTILQLYLPDLCEVMSILQLALTFMKSILWEESSTFQLKSFIIQLNGFQTLLITRTQKSWSLCKDLLTYCIKAAMYLQW